MNSSSNRLLLLGLIQDLHRQALLLGLSRTAAALDVTGHVATEELADIAAPPAPGVGASQAPAEDESSD
ncbi:MAG: hypothetical protein KDJ25_00495 [Rhodoblastus sp.]|nr:hypothetical protein [Rhodoblastus sp.]